MTVKELYQVLDANYEDAIRRLMNDELIKRFVLKFRDSNPYPELLDAYRSHDVVRVFEAAHSMKGVVGNLSLSKLYEVASNLCEVTRYKNVFDEEEVGPLMQVMVQEYEKTINRLNELS